MIIWVNSKKELGIFFLFGACLAITSRALCHLIHCTRIAPILCLVIFLMSMQILKRGELFDTIVLGIHKIWLAT
jgi:hypothetical protein